MKPETISTLIESLLSEDGLKHSPFVALGGQKKDAPAAVAAPTPKKPKEQAKLPSQTQAKQADQSLASKSAGTGERGSKPGSLCGCTKFRCKAGPAPHEPHKCDQRAVNAVVDGRYVCGDCARSAGIEPSEGDEPGGAPGGPCAGPGCRLEGEVEIGGKYYCKHCASDAQFEALASGVDEPFVEAHSDAQTYHYGGEVVDSKSPKNATKPLTPAQISWLVNDRGYVSSARDEYIDAATGKLKEPDASKFKNKGKIWDLGVVRNKGNFLYSPKHYRADAAALMNFSGFANSRSLVAITPEAKAYVDDHGRNVEAKDAPSHEMPAKNGDIVRDLDPESGVERWYVVTGEDEDGEAICKPLIGSGLTANVVIGERLPGRVLVVSRDEKGLKKRTEDAPTVGTLESLGPKQGERILSRVMSVPSGVVKSIDGPFVTLEPRPAKQKETDKEREKRESEIRRIDLSVEADEFDAWDGTSQKRAAADERVAKDLQVGAKHPGQKEGLTSDEAAKKRDVEFKGGLPAPKGEAPKEPKPKEDEASYDEGEEAPRDVERGDVFVIKGDHFVVYDVKEAGGRRFVYGKEKGGEKKVKVGLDKSKLKPIVDLPSGRIKFRVVKHESVLDAPEVGDHVVDPFEDREGRIVRSDPVYKGGEPVKIGQARVEWVDGSVDEYGEKNIEKSQRPFIDDRPVWAVKKSMTPIVKRTAAQDKKAKQVYEAFSVAAHALNELSSPPDEWERARLLSLAKRRSIVS